MNDKLKYNIHENKHETKLFFLKIKVIYAEGLYKNC